MWNVILYGGVVYFFICGFGLVSWFIWSDVCDRNEVVRVSEFRFRGFVVFFLGFLEFRSAVR